MLHIDMVVGNDYYSKLVTGRVFKEKGMLAMESKFGWLLSGFCDNSQLTNQVSCFKI